MKKIVLLIVGLSLAILSYSQAPEGINYQAVARNGSGGLIKSSNLNVRMTVLSGIGGTTQVYQESHGVSTNEYGLFTLKLGKGAPLSGTFSSIDWSANEYHVQVEVDNGAGFIDMGKSQMMSVPFALYAKTSGSGGGASTLNSLTDVNAPSPSANQVLSWDGSNWIPITTSGGTTYSGGTGINLSGTTFNAQTTSALWNANQLQGRTVATTMPSTNQVLKWNGSSWSPAADAGGASYSGGTGINLSGSTFNAQTTSALWNANQLQGRSVATTMPSTNQVLKWNGSSWSPAADAGGASYSGGTGITLSGSTFNAQTTSALWNANQLRGRNILGTAPSTNQVLKWNGSAWAPATDATGGGSSPWTTSGANVYRNSGNVGIGTTNPTSRLVVTGSATVDGTRVLSLNATGGSGSGDSYSGLAATMQSTAGNGIAISGESNGVSSGFNLGVRGSSNNATAAGQNRGVQGVVNGNSANNIAILGFSNSANTAGDNIALYGSSDLSTGNNYGVLGFASAGNAGSTNFAIYGSVGAGSGTKYAGYFDGDVEIVGNLTKSSGTFKIDHPLDPSNKYLIHSFVESPDMMNIYNGNITTDANGLATVTLPSYFEAANKEFRYQLTPIGQFAQVIVLEEISKNTFVVKSDKPNVKLSWQVTGVRNDKYAQEHRIVDEVVKKGKEKGKYLHPELFGADKTEAVYYKDLSNLKK